MKEIKQQTDWLAMAEALCYRSANLLETPASRGELLQFKRIRQAVERLKDEETGSCLEKVAVGVFGLVIGFTVLGWLLKKADNNQPSPASLPLFVPTSTPDKRSAVPSPSVSKETNINMQILHLTPEDINHMAKEISRGDTTRKAIALTFDAGGDSNWKDIKKILDKYGVQATIFPTGQFIEKHKEDVADMVRSGMEIGDHSYSHPKFTDDSFRTTLLTEDQIRMEIRKFQKALDDAAGFPDRHYPARFFRFPYGNRNEDVRRKVAKMGLQSIYWTTDSGGWLHNDSNKVLKTLYESLAPENGYGYGNIIVMHIGNEADKRALEVFLPDVLSRGYQVVPVSGALARDQHPPSILRQIDMGYTGPFAFAMPE